MECQCRVLDPETDPIEQRACPRGGGARADRGCPADSAAETRDRIAVPAMARRGDAVSGGSLTTRDGAKRAELQRPMPWPCGSMATRYRSAETGHRPRAHGALAAVARETKNSGRVSAQSVVLGKTQVGWL